MSTFKNPVGPQPGNVYWRRRLIVGLAALAVIVIVVLIFARPGSSGTPKTTSKPVTNSSAPSTPAAVAGAACVPSNIQLQAVTDKASYAAGEKPQLSLTITNVGPASCTLSVGTDVQEFIITSGSETIWDSKDCQQNPVSGQKLLEPNTPVSTATIAWDRTRSSTKTCTTARPEVTAGGASYHLSVKVGSITSAKSKQFILK